MEQEGRNPKLLDRVRLTLRAHHYSRRTVLPQSIQADLKQHLEPVRRRHKQDLREDAGRVTLPDALARKYPNADRE